MLVRAVLVGLGVSSLLGCAADDRSAGAGANGGPPQDAGVDGSRSPGGGPDGPSSVERDASAAARPEADAQAALDQINKCGAVSQMAENKRQPVDIIIGVDTTSSMIEEIGFTEQSMNAFSQQISAAGIDVRVILIAGLKDGMQPFPVYVEGVCVAAPLGSGSCPDDAKLPAYVHISKPLANWDMLQSYVDLYPMYKQHLRPDSLKSFVSISDGNVGGNVSNFIYQIPIDTPEEFMAAVNGLEPGTSIWKSWRYSAIYAYTACGIGNEVGSTHAALVKATSGVEGDLCLQNFEPVFDDLAKQVVDVAGLACDWEIPPPPMGKSFDANKTNVQVTLDGRAEALSRASSAAECGGREGWHYDDPRAPRRVFACPASCTRIQAAGQAKVDLLFGCDTVPLL